ncbi:Glycosyltransferase 2-like domain-containing protein [Tumidithrix helvetica PCC 7403]|uniref:tetratricopeptide repeat-containing glycosyltransferase family 2 protein n=1 Tax=Tumidithrix helvetica TaxID=3457545 RepID=UPI003C99C697
MTTLSLCMIVKNESKNLSRCLDSVVRYVDEIVIVDTGSEDNTIDIAKQYGAKVDFFQWCDDFAAARNYALSKVTGDWVFVIDADEELVCKSDNLRDYLVLSSEILAFSIMCIDPYHPNMTNFARLNLFRNCVDLRYHDRYHENLKFQNQFIPNEKVGRIEDLYISLFTSYAEQKSAKNINRNIPILERARREEGLSLKLLYCLAGMYNDAGKVAEAEDCYSEALERLLPNLWNGYPPQDTNFLPSLLFVLGSYSLLNQDNETAMLISQNGLKWFSNYPPLIYLAGAVLRSLGFTLGATTYFQRCLFLGNEKSFPESEPFDRSYITTYPSHDLGCSYYELGEINEAISAFKLALSFDPDFISSQSILKQIEKDLVL